MLINMKFIKMLLVSLFIVAASFYTNISEVKAAYSCPSAKTNCSAIDAAGGCQDPCIRVVTQQGAPRGGVAECQCQEPNNPSTKLGVGKKCQQ